MWLAWVLFPLFGIFVSRYLKVSLGPKWYYIHIAFMGLLTATSTIVAFVIIVIAKQGPQFVGENLIKDVHFKVGLAIFLLMFVQIALGAGSNVIFDKEKKRTEILHTSHRYLGRPLVLAGIANVSLGVYFWKGISIWLVVGHYAVLTIGSLVFLYREVTVGPAKSYVALADDQ